MQKKCNMKRVALIVPAEPEKAPYLHYYVNLLAKNNIDYDLIAWNRSGNYRGKDPHVIMFMQRSLEGINVLRRFVAYNDFCHFVKERLQVVDYDLVIVHTIFPAVLLRKILSGKYRRKFVLDIRDRGAFYSCLRPFLKRLLKHSAFNVISSPGFKSWLPNVHFYLSHNIGLVSIANLEKINVDLFNKGVIRILSIGQIRFYDANKYMIDELSNDTRYYLHYAGIGPDAERLKNYCGAKKIDNVFFSGRYQKHAEPSILSDCDFVNIIFPKRKGTLSAMPNRFYGAVIHRKPVLVTEGSVQAEYVKKYGLGIVVNEKESLKTQIENYIANFDATLFENGCMSFLEEIQNDITNFERKLQDLLEH